MIRLCSDINKKKFGIYMIRNNVNSKIYIGSTRVNFNLRWNQHFTALNLNKHTNIHLQNSYNKKDKTWYFEIVEIIEDKFLIIEREKYWIEKLSNLGIYLYNIDEVKFGNFKMSEESKLKVSKSKKGQRSGIKPDNYEELRRKWLRPIIEYYNNEVLREHESIKAAGIFHNIDYRLIWNILAKRCKGLQKMPGYFWKYKYPKI